MKRRILVTVLALLLALGAVTADDLSHFKNGQKWAKRLGLR